MEDITPQAAQAASAVSRPRRIRPKFGRNLLSCSFLVLVFALSLLFLCLLVVQKSGLLDIPGFTYFYRGPHPTRVIAAQPITLGEFKSLIGERCYALYLAGKTAPYVVRLDEGDLTAALEKGIVDVLAGQLWRPVRSQVVVRSDALEFSGEFVSGPMHIRALASFVPVMEGDKVRFDPVYIQLGDFVLPAAVAYRALGYVFSRDLGDWRLSFGDAVLQKVELEDGAMLLTLSKVVR